MDNRLADTGDLGVQHRLDRRLQRRVGGAGRPAQGID
jgi:hypothetical protein